LNFEVHKIATMLVVLSSDRFADHLTPPGHPERVERAEALRRVALAFRQSGGRVVEPVPATLAEVERVHDPSYVAAIRQTAGRAVALDPDTFTSPDSYDVALLAAGAAVGAVDAVLDGPPGTRALAVVRPPGHHAERDRAMGFCLFNNVAIAAAHARARGLDRVAIVDYDVHHGNGTQWSFYDDPAVLFVSTHQFPFYPGTGGAGECGRGAGAGFTVNLPIAAGGTDADYERLFVRVVLPVLRQFSPRLVLVSAGFDAHRDDPLGGMQLTTAQCGRLTAHLADLADACCDGRIVAITEGGYDLDAIADCTRTVIEVLGGSRTTGDFAAPAGSAPRAEATLAAVLPEIGRYWRL
jgi:acetoin utilization deacetylase AcuC-like enzyme